MSRTLLVIPHYNDTERLIPFLAELVAVLPGHFSVLISDDGSCPQQQKKLTELINRLKAGDNLNRVEILPPRFVSKNTGKGGAVHRGWENTNGFSLLAFADADGAVNATEIMRAESFFRSDSCAADALFASRVKMLGHSIHRSLLRHFTGRIFSTLVSGLTQIPVYDSQCGFKIVKKSTYLKIQSFLKTTGFAFDVELLLLLLKSGAKVVEFPVDWYDVAGSKIRLFGDSLRMAMQIFIIKKRANSLILD